MIIIDVKKHKSIEGALKAYKGKFQKMGIVNELRERSEFTKPSVRRREEVKKAKYIQSKRDEGTKDKY